MLLVGGLGPTPDDRTRHGAARFTGDALFAGSIGRTDLFDGDLMLGSALEPDTRHLTQ